MAFFEQGPKNKGLAPVAVHHVGPKLPHQPIHIPAHREQGGGVEAVERQCQGFQPQFTGFEQGRRIRQARHQCGVARRLQSMGQGHAVPRRGVVPAHIDHLDGTNGLPRRHRAAPARTAARSRAASRE